MRQTLLIRLGDAAIVILAALAVAVVFLAVFVIMQVLDGSVGADVPDQTYYEADANFERYCSRTVYFSSTHNRESPYICDLHQRLRAMETER